VKLWGHTPLISRSKVAPIDAVREGLSEVFPRIWRYALTLTGKREWADDLAQSVCLRAIERAAQFEPGTKLDRWLFRITHNLWISELRKEKLLKGGGLVTIDEIELTDPQQDLEHTLLEREVMLSVFRLPEAQRPRQLCWSMSKVTRTEMQQRY
jgi:RNA polymerase sigma-70 factor (ECF subfamily)